VMQRAVLFVPFLSGVPYPFEPGADVADGADGADAAVSTNAIGGGINDGSTEGVESGAPIISRVSDGRQPQPPSATAQAIEDNFPAILAEFEALLANPVLEPTASDGSEAEVEHRTSTRYRPAGNPTPTDAAENTQKNTKEGDSGAGEGDAEEGGEARPGARLGFQGMEGRDLGLVEHGDPAGWQSFEVCRKGRWDAAQCNRLPTLCRLLMADKAVSGRISPEKVAVGLFLSFFVLAVRFYSLCKQQAGSWSPSLDRDHSGWLWHGCTMGVRRSPSLHRDHSGWLRHGCTMGVRRSPSLCEPSGTM
jgi:hypothetical protein